MRVQIDSQDLLTMDHPAREPGYALRRADRKLLDVKVLRPKNVDYVEVYRPGGQLLAVLIKKCLDDDLVEDTHQLLRTVNGDPKNRPGIIGEKARQPEVRADGTLSERVGIVPRAVIKAYGGKADMLGHYHWTKPPSAGAAQCGPTAWTMRKPELYKQVLKFVKEIDGIYRAHLPNEYAKQMEYVDTIKDDFKIRDTAFTTLYVLKNAPTATHVDTFDYPGAFGVMATLGNFQGGEICFPRFRIAIDYQPGDLLLADVHQLHGNFPVLSGERVACVLFVRKGIHKCPVDAQVSSIDLSEGLVGLSQSAPGAWSVPQVWDCHAGKSYPPDAVYVGCRVRDRKGNVIREGTIFGNGTDPLVSHRGGLKTEREFREYAEQKLQDPEFREKAKQLRGKHLLCWCVQSGPKREEFCHARVWLELLNGPERHWGSEDPASEKRRDFDWGHYEPNFLSKEEADALFEMAKAQPRRRPKIKRSGHLLRRCASRTWSVGDKFAESVPLMTQLKDAPAEIFSLQRKLTDLAGKEVNYFSMQAYENERDHIGWHQHREDKCRDARVFIISLGERRSFGVDKLCSECLLCDNCNRRRCRLKAPPCSTRAKCKAAKKHRSTCGVRKSTKTILLPKHGSLITLTSEANDWYEHAVLDDKEPKGLRISINTKCIPPEDAAEGHVPRELRLAAHHRNSSTKI
jgi:2OG-Fe(II) oxygenase superfamily/Domain of unknown function (DUF4326)